MLIEDELKKYGIKFTYLNRPSSNDSPEEELLHSMQGVIAEYEKAKIQERTRRGKLHKVKRGNIVGSIAPYGYLYKDGHYVINDVEAYNVRLIFGFFLENRLSIRAIARELTKRGIKPRKGVQWRTSTLHRILRNETYIGTTYFNKHASVVSHKQLVLFLLGLRERGKVHPG